MFSQNLKGALTKAQLEELVNNMSDIEYEENGESYADLEVEHIEADNSDTSSEQNMSGGDESSSENNEAYFIGRDKISKWYKIHFTTYKKKATKYNKSSSWIERRCTKNIKKIKFSE